MSDGSAYLMRLRVEQDALPLLDSPAENRRNLDPKPPSIAGKSEFQSWDDELHGMWAGRHQRSNTAAAVFRNTYFERQQVKRLYEQIQASRAEKAVNSLLELHQGMRSMTARGSPQAVALRARAGSSASAELAPMRPRTALTSPAGCWYSARIAPPAPVPEPNFPKEPLTFAASSPRGYHHAQRNAKPAEEMASPIESNPLLSAARDELQSRGWQTLRRGWRSREYAVAETSTPFVRGARTVPTVPLTLNDCLADPRDMGLTHDMWLCYIELAQMLAGSREGLSKLGSPADLAGKLAAAMKAGRIPKVLHVESRLLR